MLSWKSVVGKLWMTIIGLVAVVLFMLGLFLIQYIDTNFANSNDVKRLFIYTGIIGFLLTTFFALFLSTRITKPLLDLKKAADSISEGDYDAEVKIDSSDELGQLGRAFNLMAKQLEETIKDLKHEKEHLGSVLRSMNDAVITFDASGHIILVNPQGKHVLQQWGEIAWNNDATSGTPIDDDDVLQRSVPEPLRDIFESVVNGTQELTASLHVHDGIWSVVMTPLYTNDTVRGAVAVLRDVTEEQRLVKLRKDFVANVSHELRTPLSMLQGYSEALIDDIAASPEERQELAQIIHDESLRMSRLVKDLLDLTTMEVGHLTLNRRHINIHELNERVVRKFTSAAKDVELSYVAAEQMPAVYCDEDRMEQVLFNLIDNAMRHSMPGSRIEVRCNIDEAEGGSIGNGSGGRVSSIGNGSNGSGERVRSIGSGSGGSGGSGGGGGRVSSIGSVSGGSGGGGGRVSSIGSVSGGSSGRVSSIGNGSGGSGGRVSSIGSVSSGSGRTGGSEPMLLIEVEDEGTGIHAEDLGYIFERFYKADKARTREGSGGTGLGLSIVKNIVEAHGGHVQVRSVFGEGSVFSVYIPVRAQA